ncbi:MAG: sugar ABC transporter substrate-binding protein [Candidatus Vecturithrix sp.]|nr:sugar ABC transporter substrate-binding protein [Candidatus Vecturithrix sp.]
MLTKFFRVCMIVTITAGFAIAGISAEAKVKLTMVETITSPERTALIQGFLNEFTQAHPDIEIELISPPYEGSDQKLNLMLNTNQPIDVYEVRDFFIKGYVNNKKLLDLSEFTKDWPEYENLLPLTQKVMHIVDDTPYFIPYGYFIKGLFYRKDILEEKGIAVPATMAELIEASKKLTDPEKGTYGFAFRGGSSEVKFTDVFAMSYLDNIDPEIGYMTTDGQAYFDLPQAIQGLKDWITLYQEGSPKDSLNWGWNEQVSGFVSGMTPLLWQDPDTVAICLQRLGGDEKFSVAPMPVGPSGKVYLDYGNAGWGIASYSEHKKEAWELIKFLSSKEVNVAFSKHNGTLPISKAAMDDPYFSSGVYAGWKEMFENPDKYVFILLPFDKEEYASFTQEHRTDFQNVLLGKMSPEDAAKKWADVWRKVYAK